MHESSTVKEHTTEPYTIEGDNLAQVSVDIFDRKGPLLNGKRYAGAARLSFRFKYNYVFNPNKKTLTVKITDVTWLTTFTLPEWSFPDNLSQNERNEWNRFLAALTVHEQGHKAIYEEFMPKVKMSVVGQTVTLMNIAKLPELDENNEGKTEADKAILKQLDAAVEAKIKADNNYSDMNTKDDNYDKPMTNDNPIGTDHGKTQMATLNTTP